MSNRKFRRLVANRYPIVLIDEYQDTDADWIEAVKQHFLEAAADGLGHPFEPIRLEV